MGACSYLPLRILRPELLDELVGVGEEVVLVVLVADLVLLLALDLHVLNVLVQHQMPVRSRS